MEPVFTEAIDERHSIEIGWSTWNPEAVSIRNRYNQENGRFDPKSSSEIPIDDLPDLVRVALERLPEVMLARQERGRSA
jgi:hypothetical protein